MHDSNDALSKTAMQGRWEHFEHEADIGVRGIGGTLETAFSEAAKALTSVITTLDKVEAQSPISLTVEATGVDLLFLEWLDALIYEIATRNMLFSRFEVKISESQPMKLSAVAWGEEIDLARHTPAVEVKAATFAAMGVERNSDGNWVAQCVVDV